VVRSMEMGEKAIASYFEGVNFRDLGDCHRVSLAIKGQVLLGLLELRQGYNGRRVCLNVVVEEPIWPSGSGEETVVSLPSGYKKKLKGELESCGAESVKQMVEANGGFSWEDVGLELGKVYESDGLKWQTFVYNFGEEGRTHSLNSIDDLRMVGDAAGLEERIASLESLLGQRGIEIGWGWPELDA